MARIITEGYEQGELWAVCDTYTDGISLVSNPVKSGTRALQVTASNIQARQAVINLDAPLSAFACRVAFRYNYEANTTIVIFAKDELDQVGISITSNGRLRATVGGNVVETGTEVLRMNTWYTIEGYFVIDNVSGVIQVRVDGVLDIDYSGNTVDTYSEINQFILARHYTLAQSWYDDIALNDFTGTEDNSWCGSGRIIMLMPNGAGDVTQLTPDSGNNWDRVKDRPNDGDSSYVEGDTVGLYDLYTITGHGLSNVDIKRIWLDARARDVAAEGGEISTIMKTNGVEHEGSNVSLLSSYLRVIRSNVYTLNPETSAPWSLSDLSNLQIGTKIKSLSS